MLSDVNDSSKLNLLYKHRRPISRSYVLIRHYLYVFSKIDPAFLSNLLQQLSLNASIPNQVVSKPPKSNFPKNDIVLLEEPNIDIVGFDSDFSDLLYPENSFVFFD